MLYSRLHHDIIVHKVDCTNWFYLWASKEQGVGLRLVALLYYNSTSNFNFNSNYAIIIS